MFRNYLSAALRNLEHDGFVDSYEEPGPSARGGRPRRYYRLPAAGARAAMEQREVGVAVFAIPGAAACG